MDAVDAASGKAETSATMIGEKVDALKQWFDDATKVNGAISGLFSVVDGLLTGIGETLTHTYDSVKDIAASLSTIGAKFDTFTDKIVNFIDGEVSPLSEAGNAALGASAGDNPLSVSKETDLSVIIKTPVSGTSACPADITAEVLGRTLSFSYQPLCDWGEVVGKFILIVAGMVSLRIIASGGF